MEEFKMKMIAFAITIFLGLGAMVGMVAALNPLNGDDWDYDPDQDGLTNLDEFLAGSDPNNWDSDGDGLPDGWEVNNDLDPTDPMDADEDFDYFGGEEYASYTQVDPPYDNYAEYFRLAGVDADTGEDIYIPTNPNHADTDGDGVLDPDDSWPWDFSNDGTSNSGNGGPDSGGAGSGPAVGGNGDGDGDGNPDDDGDGLTDMEEMALGTDFNNPDTDGDGLRDDQEIRLGLDPNDWDTDNDMLIDGVELAGSDSTDGHVEDTDNDGIA
jgi:thrombospondin type 3 repeat protein